MRGYICIGLYNPKNEINVGSAMRAAAAFRASFVCLIGSRTKSGCTDTGKAYRHIPLLYSDDPFSLKPDNCDAVAVEFQPNGSPEYLPHFKHPERAYYLFGGEDVTLGSDIISRCDRLVTIPSMRCLNLAAAVNVTLYDRISKSWTSEE